MRSRCRLMRIRWPTRKCAGTACQCAKETRLQCTAWLYCNLTRLVRSCRWQATQPWKSSRQHNAQQSAVTQMRWRASSIHAGDLHDPSLCQLAFHVAIPCPGL